MRTALKTAATTEALRLGDIKRHLRLSTGYATEDKVFNILKKAARLKAEVFTNRKFINQTWYSYLDQWPSVDYIALPYPPLSTGTSPILTYKDSEESTTTVSSTKYRADSASVPGRLVLGYGDDWPSETLWTVNPIRAEYVCGYGALSTNMPEDITNAMLLMVGHMYENREDSIAGQGLTLIPEGSKALLYPYRDWRF